MMSEKDEGDDGSEFEDDDDSSDDDEEELLESKDKAQPMKSSVGLEQQRQRQQRTEGKNRSVGGTTTTTMGEDRGRLKRLKRRGKKKEIKVGTKLKFEVERVNREDHRVVLLIGSLLAKGTGPID